MKKRRFLRKAIKPGFICLYLLIIAIAIFVVAITAKKYKLTTTDAGADNVEFNEENFKDNDMSKVEFEEGVDYNEWLAQNDKYVLYFNKQTTIATIYQIEYNAKTGNKVTHNGVEYDEIDITKCKKSYATAQSVGSGLCSNLVVQYADSTSGKLVQDTFTSYSSSVQYFNKLTEETEAHYFLNYVENGVQILYEIGNFSAGIDYLPENLLATLYKPEEEAYLNKDGELEEESYNNALKRWSLYMAKLGVDNALDIDIDEDEGYQTVLRALSKTFEERFRGNCIFFVKKQTVGDQTRLNYTGSMRVYTSQAAKYVDELIAANTPGLENAEKSETSTKETNTNNIYWTYTGIDSSFFTDGLVYFNNDDSPLTVNPYMNNTAYSEFSGSAYKMITNSTKYRFTDDESDFSYIFWSRQAIKGSTLTSSYNKLYKYTEYVQLGTTYYNEEGLPYMVGGFAKRDNEGKFVYEGGQLVQDFYTLELVGKDAELFGTSPETSLAVFQIGLQILLTDNGIEATLMSDSFIDSENAKESTLEVTNGGEPISKINKKYILYSVQVFPYMNYVDNTGKEATEKETGMIVVPDGSGAYINFNNGKSNMNATAVNKNYYGTDEAFINKAISEETEDLMLGMYGFIYTTAANPRGMLSIIEKGGNQISLYAYTNDKVVQSFFTAKIRLNETVKIGAYIGGQKTFNKWTSELCHTDLQFKYDLLDETEASYTGLANKYREYLMKKYNITSKDTTTSTVVDLNFLGAFEKYALLLGFKYKTPDSLTTFAQAAEIVEELQSGIDVDGNKLAVQNLNVSYTGWTNEEMEYQLGGSIKASSVLGGAKGMRNLANTLKEKNIDFYPEVYVATTRKGFDVSFGKLKYATRSITNETAIEYQFNVATQRQNKKVSYTAHISPSYYESITDDVIKRIDKINVGDNLGYYAIDIGNQTTGDYGKSRPITFGQDSIVYQRASLAKMKANGKVKVSAPYDYAFEYVDFATDVPLTSTNYPIYDATIPFYQLVVSGLFDYSTDTVNGTSNRSSEWYFAKAIESGSNLSFEISAENPNILLDTDYTLYYQAYYHNWKETIVKMANKIDALGIAQGRLIYHDTITKDISHVKYQTANGIIEAYVNATGVDYKYNSDITIPAYSYYKVN